jgi:DNA-directed RNA polymerase specialized sigma24 family protein
LRSLKSSRRQDIGQAQTIGNGYDQLEGEWLTYYRVASRFAHKTQTQDREDLLHDIMLTIAQVERNNGHKPFTELTMYRIASRKVADYWRDHYKLTNGCDCGHCSQSQRATCLKDWLGREYSYHQCPKAKRMDALSRPVLDSEGNTTELGELIADDKAIDVDAWLDTKTFLQGCPQRLIAIAERTSQGQSLPVADRKYLWKWRKREQLALGVTN